MRSIVLFVAFFNLFLNGTAQVQLYPFGTQVAYDSWNQVSSLAPTSFSYDLTNQSVNYAVSSSDGTYLLSTQVMSTALPFSVSGSFTASFKVRKLLSSSSNSYFPLLLTNAILGAPNEHPWRLGPTNPASLGNQQTVPLLGVIFTDDQIGFVYRQNNSSTAQINYIENFNLPSNTDLWVELKKTCTFGFRLSVFDTPAMNNVPLAVETTNLVNISVPLNALYIANCNGNGLLTEQNDLLDDYRVELLPNSIIDFQYSITPPTCTTPGLVMIDQINGGIAPYSISFNGTLSADPFFLFQDEEAVEVTVTDNSGCYASSSVNLPSASGVGTVNFPNVFTPNKDNVNDKWFATGNCIKTFNCVLLDRWGNEIITLTSIDQSWDGSFKNKNCSDGVYFYRSTVEFSSGEKADYQGFISLIR